jgi:hypothetical protein
VEEVCIAKPDLLMLISIAEWVLEHNQEAYSPSIPRIPMPQGHLDWIVLSDVQRVIRSTRKAINGPA